MIKGAFIFAAGLAVGTVYGFGYGLRLSKAIGRMADEAANQSSTPRQTVPGDVIMSDVEGATA